MVGPDTSGQRRVAAGVDVEAPLGSVPGGALEVEHTHHTNDGILVPHLQIASNSTMQAMATHRW